MNDLPDVTGKNSSPTTPASTPLVSSIGGKEKEGIGFSNTEFPMQDIGKEVDLPKEVSALGVKTQPTTVPLPVPLAAMGVKQAGYAVVAQPPSQQVPLTDDQIAIGIHQSIVDSIRWLAEWCKRRLKQVRVSH